MIVGHYTEDHNYVLIQLWEIKKKSQSKLIRRQTNMNKKKEVNQNLQTNSSFKKYVLSSKF